MTALSEQQLKTLSEICRYGAADASDALSKWLGREIRVLVENVEQATLEVATELLGPADTTVCVCCMRVTGGVNGQLLLGFDDASGLMLCDALLSRETPATEWGELEMSAAMETTNIVGCAFLNALAKVYPASTHHLGDADEPSWIPTPPVFVRDFAASIMQFALVDQTCAFDQVLIAKTQFTIDGTPIGWRLLLIPDAESLERMARIMP
jgi:chemotaxis protein CheC